MPSLPTSKTGAVPNPVVAATINGDATTSRGAGGSFRLKGLSAENGRQQAFGGCLKLKVPNLQPAACAGVSPPAKSTIAKTPAISRANPAAAR